MDGFTVTVTIDDARLDELIRETKPEIAPWIVSDGVEYGIFQEVGTERIAARPCARPAVEEARKYFQAQLQAKAALTAEDVGEIVETTAFEVERLWKQVIQDKGVIDTGAYLNSVHAEAA